MESYGKIADVFLEMGETREEQVWEEIGLFSVFHIGMPFEPMSNRK